MAITRIFPSPRISWAGFSAGSMPITGISISARSVAAAALVAVLQAITSALILSSVSRPTTCLTQASTSSLLFVP